MRATINVEIIVLAATPDSHPDCRALLIQIVALQTLKAEIDVEAWESLNSDVSRAFPKPKSGRIAVKVINHLGDEVMKVFEVR